MIQQLEQQIALLKIQLLLKDEQIKSKEEQLQRKNERILYLECQLFGRRSEKKLPEYNQAQLSLFDAEQGAQSLEMETPELISLVEDIKQKAEKRRNTKKELSVTQKRSYKIPADIERRETILNPENVDTSSMIKIGEDVTERLMLDQAKFWVERTVRPVYKMKQEKDALSTTIVQAPLKPTILPGSMVGESVISQVILDKFLYHIPENRQAKRFKPLGMDITTSRINRWVHGVADKLYALYIAQMKRILSADYIQVDETTHSITDRPGSARKGYTWVLRSVKFPGVFFHYYKGSRSQEVILKLLKDYKGALQTDGYAVYSIYEEKQGVLPLGCMAHVRRKFENALSYYPRSTEGPRLHSPALHVGRKPQDKRSQL